MDNTTLAGTRILLVEDDASISMMMEEFMETLGCVVVAAPSRLAAAAKQAAEGDFDMATLDINLAGELSYPVADILRSRAIPFLFVTGYGTLGVPDHLRDAPLLAKPFPMRQLAAILGTIKASRIAQNSLPSHKNG